MIDINGSLDTLRENRHIRQRGPWKIAEDLERYERIIDESLPDLIIETGTRDGESARWFATVAGCPVITVDVQKVELRDLGGLDITTLMGDSVHPRILRRINQLAGGFRRVMVSLDSDHSTAHVANEIMAYGPLVSVGCYLVVEDGIFHYADAELREQHALGEMVGDPLTAITGSALPHSSRWARNRYVEDMFPVTHHPAGWWRRVSR